MNDTQSSNTDSDRREQISLEPELDKASAEDNSNRRANTVLNTNGNANVKVDTEIRIAETLAFLGT